METLKNYQFYWLAGEDWKSFLLDENTLYLSSKKHKDSSDLLDTFEKKSLISLVKTKSIDINTITHLSHLENNNILSIHYDKKSVNLTFDDAQTTQQIAKLLSNICSFTLKSGSQRIFQAITPYLIFFGLSIAFTFVLYGMASNIEAGIEVDTSGRRGWAKEILAWAAGILGCTGSLIAGALLAILCLFYMYKAYKNPPTEHIYSSEE